MLKIIISTILMTDDLFVGEKPSWTPVHRPIHVQAPKDMGMRSVIKRENNKRGLVSYLCTGSQTMLLNPSIVPVDRATNTLEIA